jgi:hypothetical protein
MAGTPGWEEVYDYENRDGDEGRIAIVVEAGIWDGVAASIYRFKDDLELEGHDVLIAKFTGGLDGANVLRDTLRLEYQSRSLSGAVLVGHLPHATYEFWHDVYAPYEGAPQPYPYVSFPTDAFFMDLDGEWEKDHCTASVCQPEYYDYWQRSELEIWVSRIRVDNLVDLMAETEMSEVEIINAYFDRNHEHRVSLAGPLAAGEHALAVESHADAPCSPAGAAYLSAAFASVAHICADGLSESTYIGALTATSPRNYFIHVHAHGSQVGHMRLSQNRDTCGVCTMWHVDIHG